MDPKFILILRQRKEKGSERSLLSFDTPMIDFWSNDYLGLGRKQDLLSVQSGSGSRLISGNTQTMEEVERFLACHFQSAAALMFNSGYDANIGFFSAVPQKGDTILYDELIHASVRDGLRLSFAKSFSFEHNDLHSLEARLKKAEGSVFVAVESIYSMDGDLAPLKEMARLCERYQAFLVVDEAHAGAVFGKNGIGLCEEAGIIETVFARLITFGKGFGAHGAVWLGSEQLRAYLINFARSFIYTTALPEAFYMHVQQQVEAAKNEGLRQELFGVITRFRELIPGISSNERSPIQVIPFQDLTACKQIAEQLQTAGFAVKAILPPTVPEGGQRLRVCLHAFNQEAELISFAALLTQGK